MLDQYFRLRVIFCFFTRSRSEEKVVYYLAIKEIDIAVEFNSCYCKTQRLLQENLMTLCSRIQITSATFQTICMKTFKFINCLQDLQTTRVHCHTLTGYLWKDIIIQIKIFPSQNPRRSFYVKTKQSYPHTSTRNCI